MGPLHEQPWTNCRSIFRFKIVGCDPPTRDYFANDLHNPQPADLPMPEGKYDVTRRVRQAVLMLT